ncbi:MAG: beta strand repeat-containing protein [Mangrovibacterium sp.]
MRTKFQSFKFAALLALLVINLSGYTQTSKTTYDFSAGATILPDPVNTFWNTIAKITIDGTVYVINDGINGSLTLESTGGASGACLKKEGSGGAGFSLSREDGQPFQFYGIWVKQQSMNYYVNFGVTLPPWYTVTASSFIYKDMSPIVGSTVLTDYQSTTTTQTVDAGTSGVTTTSVSINFNAILFYWIDNIVVGPVPASAGTVTTQAVSNINGTTATAKGTITATGSPSPTAHGFCWNTTGSPTTGDFVADKGVISSTGSFTANLTGLTPSQTYYIRAFVTNTGGTSYGEEVTFTTLAVDWDAELFEDEVAGASTFNNNGFTFNITGGNLEVFNYPWYGWDGGAADDFFVDNSTSLLTAAGIIGSFKIQTATFNVKDIYVFPSEDGSDMDNTGDVIFRGKLGGSTVFTQTLPAASINTDYGVTNGLTYVDFGPNSLSTIDELEFEVTGSLRFLEIDAFRHLATAVTGPTVTSVSVPANGTYTAGNSLNFTVNFSENTIVDITGGTPRLALTIGTTTQYASYVSGSGSQNLVFTYPVQAGDNDPDGLSVGTLSLNGGTLKDNENNDASLTLNSVGGTSGVLVDALAPSVSGVTVPAGGNYKTGDNLDFTINYDENVVVATTGGTPQISLVIGSSTVQAAYVSGGGSSALVFRYTVQSGDLDTDGLTVGTLALNGGTLKDGSGNDATLTLNNLGSTSGVLVDGVAPTISGVTVPGSGNYKAGDNLDFTINYDENVVVNNTGGTKQVS